MGWPNLRLWFRRREARLQKAVLEEAEKELDEAQRKATAPATEDQTAAMEEYDSLVAAMKERGDR